MANSTAAAGAAARILIVDDDADTRELMCLALSAKGYHCDSAADGDKGLALLREHHYQLVLADYDMPGKSGIDMIREAEAAGRLRDTAVLIVTAHPDPAGAVDLPIVPKPFDVEELYAQIHTILAGRPSVPAEEEPARPPVLDLVLYTNANSATSAAAERKMREILAGYDPALLKYAVRDVVQHSDDAEADRVVYTPTLVKRYPYPRAWIVGDLRDRRVLANLVAMLGASALSTP